ncbi:MAG: SRPBCC domain-containing protein [Hyphomonas oceanitis]|uniref:SRPBCC domain-containing protein n=1 Tax=Hyphomonas oceanitis TaxID=81033 RepID=UPI003002B85C
MSHDTIRHDTVTMERTYAVSPAHVFDAWADPEKRRIWGSPSDEIDLRLDAEDFSVNGEDVTSCIMGEEAIAIVRARYHDIVPDSRIIYTESIAGLEALEGVSLVAAEFLPDGPGTRLVLTLQTLAVDGSDLLAGVQEGWESALLRLGTLVA